MGASQKFSLFKCVKCSRRSVIEKEPVTESGDCKFVSRAVIYKKQMYVNRDGEKVQLQGSMQESTFNTCELARQRIVNELQDEVEDDCDPKSTAHMWCKRVEPEVKDDPSCSIV